MNIGCSWSGGKDSCFALMKRIAGGDKLHVLLNVMDENLEYSKSHGLTSEVLDAQSKALGVPIQLASTTWSTYEKNFISNLKQMKEDYDLEGIVYGDIDIEAHKTWEEKVSAAADLKALLPLWQGHRRRLVEDMIQSGIKAIIVSCIPDLGFDFLGKEINYELLDKLEAKGVDVCGENGEYHSLVVNCPLFDHEIKVVQGEKMKVGNYCFIETNLST
ncbi:MAG: diphthine--ammonia ligase [Reichenbachiella sp.]|uniref:Dph6-related ATP pyrophosphatase n=1 Tax=Reichenbachiella sp. TaxID=2184521 RepID=UPI0032678091